MTIWILAPNSILWLWDEPKNRAYLAIMMGFMDFLPLVVVFAHFAHIGGQQSHFKHPDQFVGAPWRPPKVLNPLRYPHYSCKIPADGPFRWKNGHLPLEALKWLKSQNLTNKGKEKMLIFASRSFKFSMIVSWANECFQKKNQGKYSIFVVFSTVLAF